jgi:predicted lipid carrier protein YhbT
VVPALRRVAAARLADQGEGGSELPKIKPDELASRIAALESDQVAALIAATAEADLRAALESKHRERILDEIFRRLPDYLDPARTADVDALLEFRLQDGRGRHEPWRVAIAQGGGRAGRDLPGEPHLSLMLDAGDFLRLVIGDVNAGVLVISGALTVEGDPELAVRAPGFFRVPGEARGTDADARDPFGVDTQVMARVIAGASDQAIRASMRSPFRAAILDEVFRRFPDYLDPDHTRDVKAAIEWRITGNPDGDDDRYLVVIERGACRAGRDLGVRPRVGLKLDGVDFLKVVSGNANPAVMFLRRKIKVRGDLALAARLTLLFRVPSPD